MNRRSFLKALGLAAVAAPVAAVVKAEVQPPPLPEPSPIPTATPPDEVLDHLRATLDEQRLFGSGNYEGLKAWLPSEENCSGPFFGIDRSLGIRRRAPTYYDCPYEDG